MGVKVGQWKGAWWVFVDHKRRRKAKRIGTGQAGLRAAEDIARAYEVQLTLGTFDFSKASNVTFEGYAVEWVETYGCTLKLGTLEKYTEVLRDHWFPSLGCVRGADITRNPVILPLVRTGMRMGEALALQTADIDIDRRCIHIVRTWGSRTKADQEHRFNSSKGKRDRLVDMSKQLTGMLKLHLAQKASPTEWVYPGKDPKTADAPDDVPRPVGDYESRPRSPTVSHMR